MPLRPSLAVAVAAVWLWTAPASAVVYVMPTDESMVDRSPVIVFGEVRSAGPGERRGRPATNYVLDVEDVLKGAVAGAAIVVQQPGGVDDDGVASWIMGLPGLAEGDRVLLFLRPEEEGVHRVVEYALGIFWEVSAGGRRLLLREPSLEGPAPSTGEPAQAPEESQPPREAARFRRWIADRAAGVERPADYFEAEDPPNGLVVARSPYRLYVDCGVPARLPAFDRGESLDYVVHADGQPGVPGGGLRQVRAGMRVWNDDVRSRANLRLLRTTSERLPTEVLDNRIRRVMYEDPYDEIEGSFGDGGEKSGTLAVTRVGWYESCRPRHRIPGRETEAIELFGSNIVTQDGVGDFLRSGAVADPANWFERIIAHELGHAIGIGHPCETDEADCDDSHPHRGALMYPTTAPGDISRARLHGDDRAAVRYLYPGGGGSTPEPPPDPGGCTPTTTALRFDGGYEVSMCYRTPDGREGQAKSGVWASSQAGLLWFFDRENAEALVKVLNGCAHNGHRWVYVAPVTDLEFNLWVTGPNGRRWTHTNRQGRTAATKADTRAFQCSNEDDDDSDDDDENGGGDVGDAVSGRVTTCSADQTADSTWNATIGGSITANRSVSNVRVQGYIEPGRRRIGTQTLGSMAANQTRTFHMTGTVSGETPARCEVEATFDTAAAVPRISAPVEPSHTENIHGETR